MHCSIEPRDRIFVKGYKGLKRVSFAKNMGKNIGKNVSKNLSSKYSHKRLHHVKQSATDDLKLLQKEQFKKQKPVTE